MKYTAQIMEFGVPSKASGIVYDKEEFEKAIYEYNKNELKYGTLGEKDDLGSCYMEKISHKIDNVRIENNKAFADIEILNTPSGNMCEILMENKIQLATAPIIEIGKDGTQRILSIDLVKDEYKPFDGNTLKYGN